MTIEYHRQFKKNYTKRIRPYPTLNKRTQTRVKLFISDRSNPLLKDHPLSGDMKGYRAFSITGDVRVVYRISTDQTNTILFYDIGTHNQVYK